MKAQPQIDEYILGKLPPDEHNAFEKQLVRDQALKEEVTFRKEILVGLAEVQKKDLVSQFEAFEQGEIPLAIAEPKEEEINRSGAKIRSLRFYLSAAAAVLLLVVAVWLVRSYVSPQSNTSLFAANLEVTEALEATEVVRGQNDVNATEKVYSDWKRAVNAYNAGDLPSALLGLNQVEVEVLKVNDQSKYLYQLGLVKMLTQDYRGAKEIFDNPAVRKAEPDNASWYSALLLLAMEKDNAVIIEALKPIAESMTNPWSSKASSLIEKLD